MLKPTTELYAELQEIFDFFNQKLFAGELPNCLISLQRTKGAAGYFAYSSWENDNGKKIDEIALNPSGFKDKDLKTILSTFVHEMCHLWQSYFGTPGKNGYHNQEWSEKMQTVGLIPSHTGKKGGNKTGYKMSHFVLRGGLYEKWFEELEKIGGKMSWVESIGEQNKSYVKKMKYVCPDCNIKLWGKPNLNIICGDCNTTLQLS